MIYKKVSFLIVLLIFFPHMIGSADGNEAKVYESRDQIPEKYRWNLSDIFPSNDEWEKSKKLLPPKIKKIGEFKGTLSKSPQQMLKVLEYIDSVRREISMLSNYAGMLSDQDIRQSGPLGMAQSTNTLWTQFSSQTSFLDPEILQMPSDKLLQFIVAEPRLKIYGRKFYRIQRMKSHTLGESEEQIMAKVGLISGIASSIHNVFNNAEMPYPKITFSDGSTAEINVSNYEKYRTSSNREDRIKAFYGFFGSLGTYKGTYGAMLYGQIKENLFFRDVRKYNSIIEMVQYPRNIPVSVYTGLIDSIRKNLPTLHRYLNIRKKLLDLAELHYYDFYPDLVQGNEVKFTYEEAKSILREALRILGDDYGKKLDEAFNNRWIDVFPNPGKASGAYCSGTYDTHPYVKINFNGGYGDLTMLAHELGHAMHSCYSDQTQPYPLSGYSSFVAEVAANVNEAFLVDYLIKNTKDPRQKLAYLGSFLEEIRKTLFRQTLFAEYELVVNQMVEGGQALTGKQFSDVYLKILREYYGHEEGISVIDEVFGHEWAYISHFYIGFYNYNYSTSFAAAHAMIQKMTDGRTGKQWVQKYIKMLSSGNTKDSISLLKDAGVDMTTSEPVDRAVQKMDRALDQMEKLIKKLKL